MKMSLVYNMHVRLLPTECRYLEKKDIGNSLLNEHFNNEICYRVSGDFPEGKRLQNDGDAN